MTVQPVSDHHIAHCGVCETAANDVRQAAEARNAADTNYRQTLAQALAAGVPARHIAEAAGCSRQNVYKVARLRRAEEGQT